MLREALSNFPWCLSLTQLLDMINITPELDLDLGNVVPHFSMREGHQVCISQTLEYKQF